MKKKVREVSINVKAQAAIIAILPFAEIQSSLRDGVDGLRRPTLNGARYGCIFAKSMMAAVGVGSLGMRLLMFAGR